jgi:tetratricopeptide (TPR) repeat protein
MKAKKMKKRKDPLEGLIEAASPEILGKLIKELASDRPEIRRESFEFLKGHVTLAPEEDAVSDSEALFALWWELEPDLSELDEYGGGDYDLANHVGELLYELSKGLQEKKIPCEHRRELLDEVLPYIQSGNAGLDDALYDVAYSACYDEEDFRDLAERFEAIGRDWPINRARRIYRNIGDHKKYLELRSRSMKYGADYHDLATFYWETGERDKAVEIARKGLKEAEGRMDELRSFMMERAQESDNRSGYLELQFDQATDGLTLKDYKAFKKMCTKQEWNEFEPRILKRLEKARDAERLKIHMFRKEYDKALSLLKKSRYPLPQYDGNEILKIARDLEQLYPEEILSFYRTGLGTLNASFDRKTYAQKALVMAKLRHVWVDVMKAPEKWKEFGRKVKQMNLRRPAFQEEFAKVLPDWNTL